MKKGLLLTVSVLALAAFSFKNVVIETYSANVAKSEIGWKAYKVTGSHEGTINLKSGDLQYTDGMLSGGTFEVDMTSLASTDLKGEWKDKLDGHLKSEDFFGVENFPVAKFNITKVVPKGTPGDYKITGDLTIKETTKSIKFYANIVEEGNSRVATADIKIDRSEYDVRYGSGSFFSGLGDKTIYDEFDLSVKLVTEK